MTNPHPDRTTLGPPRARLRRLAVVAVTVVTAVAVAAHVSRPKSANGGRELAPHAGHGHQTGQLWTCSMHPQVIQEEPGVCPICHMQLTPLEGVGPGPAEHAAPSRGGSPDARKVKYWWDPMLNPPYISDKPGKSPMGMDLIPVYEDEERAPSAAVTIDPVVVQNIGVRLARVTEGPLRRTVRAAGSLEEAQPNIREVNLRVSGWIRRLYADTEGMHVRAGAPLFELYSPELQVAVEELLLAREARGGLAAGPTVRDAAVRKLQLLGLAREQIDALARLARPPEAVAFLSPISGHVTEKPVVEGSAVKPGERVLRVVDHSTLWVDARIFEQDLPFVRAGQKARAALAALPGEEYEGEITFVHPHVDMQTRTALVRLAVPNPSLTLRPGMYATVTLAAELAPRATLVPREAVIDSGERQLAFVPRGGGRFEPRPVKMGLAAGDGMVQVLEGLSPGEEVVVSGQFLLDSESRLREAVRKFLDARRDEAPASYAAGGRPE